MGETHLSNLWTPVTETQDTQLWCLHYQKSNNDHLVGFYHITGKHSMVT